MGAPLCPTIKRKTILYGLIVVVNGIVLFGLSDRCCSSSSSFSSYFEVLHDSQDDPVNVTQRPSLFRDTEKDLRSAWTMEMSEERRRILQARKEFMERKCKSLKMPRQRMPPKKKAYNNLLWSSKYKVVWCPIFKAASTTWVNYFLQLANDTSQEPGHIRARELYEPPCTLKEREALLKTAKKLLIVRHPLQRLLSAYRDKMVRKWEEGSRFLYLQLKIIDKYKNSGMNSSHHIPPPPPPPPGRMKRRSPSSVSRGPSGRSSSYPTFTQFLMNVKDDVTAYMNYDPRAVVDMHWQPYWMTCNPCALSYDLIAKVETLDLDQEYIIRDLGLENDLINLHAHASTFDTFNSTIETTRMYYSQVPTTLLQDIIRLYKVDFDLFNYSTDGYVSLTQPQ